MSRREGARREGGRVGASVLHRIEREAARPRVRIRRELRVKVVQLVAGRAHLGDHRLRGEERDRVGAEGGDVVVVVEVEDVARAVLDCVQEGEVLAAEVVPPQQPPRRERHRLLHRHRQIDRTCLAVGARRQRVRRRPLLVGGDDEHQLGSAAPRAASAGSTIGVVAAQLRQRSSPAAGASVGADGARAPPNCRAPSNVRTRTARNSEPLELSEMPFDAHEELVVAGAIAPLMPSVASAAIAGPCRKRAPSARPATSARVAAQIADADIVVGRCAVAARPPTHRPRCDGALLRLGCCPYPALADESRGGGGAREGEYSCFSVAAR